MNQETEPIFEELPQQQPPKSSYTSFPAFLFDIVEMVAWAIFAMVIIFSFAFRLCRVEGASMENTLDNGQMLLITNLGYTPQQDDIVVFHLTLPESNMEKTVVKRVIATGGQELVIDFNTATITVDGVVYEDSHRVLKDLNDNITNRYMGVHASSPYYDFQTRIFRATVPEGSLFVMGDNRNNSRDSRDPSIGFIDERCVLGKALIGLFPFETLG